MATAATYTKQDLLNDIHDLVEKYIAQELAAQTVTDEAGEIIVESDSEGDDVDTQTGDIWDLKNQKIIGRMDLKTKTKTWFCRKETPPTDQPEQAKEEQAIEEQVKQVKQAEQPEEVKQAEQPEEVKQAEQPEEVKQAGQPEEVKQAERVGQPEKAVPRKTPPKQAPKKPTKK